VEDLSQNGIIYFSDLKLLPFLYLNMLTLLVLIDIYNISYIIVMSKCIIIYIAIYIALN